jgi:Ca-activated chloride channel family protein
MRSAANRQSWWIAGLWSVAVHAALLWLAATAILDRRAPAGGGMGLVAELRLAADGPSTRDRFDDSDWGPAARIDLAPALAQAVSPASYDEQTPPADPTRVLPAVATEPVTGGGSADSPATAEARTSAANRPATNRTRTSIFGVPGEGAKFVYVFDRSASTGGPSHDTLSAAKTQLIASLEGLQPVHQFQIIFYNQTPTVFAPTRQSWGLCLATAQNKLLARRFIGSITPEGSTNHQEALRLALGLRPDVIFFLTDGDEPRLSAMQLETIGRMARGISINTIEFGVGPQPTTDDFLMQLARQNGGLYGYIDIGRLAAEGGR